MLTASQKIFLIRFILHNDAWSINHYDDLDDETILGFFCYDFMPDQELQDDISDYLSFLWHLSVNGTPNHFEEECESLISDLQTFRIF